MRAPSRYEKTFLVTAFFPDLPASVAWQIITVKASTNAAAVARGLHEIQQTRPGIITGKRRKTSKIHLTVERVPDPRAKVPAIQKITFSAIISDEIH